MKLESAAPKPIRLAEYTPPAFRIKTVDLRFELDPAATRVTNRMAVERNPGHKGAPLVLNGEHVDLLSVAVDGRELGPDAYERDERTLTLPGVPNRFELTVITECHPKDNTALEGLVHPSGNFCTQCEAEGFRTHHLLSWTART
ncbi:MAG: hypothetical protein U5K43_05605 [Halofilum sp. (in: g-proteobacteria)]|nr:hypothetical protein [Halofilum sp. (in: g-proteobacteria)]